jgi:ubiquinone/menaquinone biosynthesis C-methylase UbiE
MSDNDRGQVIASAAEIYEEFFVPALFAGWPDRLADAAHVRPGQRVLDVACGTGVLARGVAARVGAEGSVVGLDINDGMLAVARRSIAPIEWREGRAEELPFEDASFDAVVSQFGLMFFEDRAQALREMMRVLKPGGLMAVAVWDSLDHTPGYGAMVALLQRLFGDEAANRLRAPFVLGNKTSLQNLFAEAGIPNADIASHMGIAHFPSLDSWMYTDIKGWTLADLIDDAGFKRLLTDAQRILSRFVMPDGSVRFDAPALIVSAQRKP